MSFCDKKCSIQLDKLKLEKKELELLFADYQNAWECCEKGGNFTNQGYCSYEWQDKVKNFSKIAFYVIYDYLFSNSRHGEITPP